MIEPQSARISEPEGYLFMVALVGKGTSAPILGNTRNNYSVTRSGVGALKISFQDDPGPTFIGIAGFGFGDATATNVGGWTVAHGTYTARNGSTAANYTFTILNNSFAAADLASTSTLCLQLCFKQAPAAI